MAAADAPAQTGATSAGLGAPPACVGGGLGAAPTSSEAADAGHPLSVQVCLAATRAARGALHAAAGLAWTEELADVARLLRTAEGAVVAAVAVLVSRSHRAAGTMRRPARRGGRGRAARPPPLLPSPGRQAPHTGSVTTTGVQTPPAGHPLAPRSADEAVAASRELADGSTEDGMELSLDTGPDEGTLTDDPQGYREEGAIRRSLRHDCSWIQLDQRAAPPVEAEIIKAHEEPEQEQTGEGIEGIEGTKGIEGIEAAKTLDEPVPGCISPHVALATHPPPSQSVASKVDYCTRVHDNFEYVAIAKSGHDGFILIRGGEDDDCYECGVDLEHKHMYGRLFPSVRYLCTRCWARPEG